jgi:phytol kinase
VALLFTITAIFVLLLGSELYWRKHVVHDEFSRKFIHLTVGSFVAFWPFFLSWGEIQLLSLAFFVVVGISKYLHVFKAIHSVQRPTYGELFFALAVGGITFITHDPWIYMAALLQMSLADGLAAVFGVRYGRTTRYHVAGQAKSLVGTTAFFVVSLLILFGYALFAPGQSFKLVFIPIALLATLIENVGVQGLDNIAVPLVAALALDIFAS